MEERRVLCTVCPAGCAITVAYSIEGGVTSVVGCSGNRCRRGAEYAASEVVNPLRTLTTTVRVENGDLFLLPVRSVPPLPKALMARCMEELADITVTAPVEMGDVVVRNVCGSGCDMVAGRRVGIKYNWKNKVAALAKELSNPYSFVNGDDEECPVMRTKRETAVGVSR